jgi:hypothetical protein
LGVGPEEEGEHTRLLRDLVEEDVLPFSSAGPVAAAWKGDRACEACGEAQEPPPVRPTAFARGEAIEPSVALTRWRASARRSAHRR